MNPACFGWSCSACGAASSGFEADVTLKAFLHHVAVMHPGIPHPLCDSLHPRRALSGEETAARNQRSACCGSHVLATSEPGRSCCAKCGTRAPAPETATAPATTTEEP